MSDDPLREPGLEETVRRLERGLPRVAPPGDLLDSVLARIEDEAPAPARRAPRRSLADLLPRWRPVALGLAAAAAVAIVVTLALPGNGLGTPDARAAVVAHRASGVQGEADLFRSDSSRGVVVVRFLNLPAAPAGHHYPVWVLRQGSHEMTPVGSFTPSSRRVKLTLPLPGAGHYAALDVSLQGNDAPPANSGLSVAGASFS